MEIIYKKIEDLNPAEYNPRQITTKQYKDLKESIKRFGLVDPIIINQDNTIIGGHQRFKIMQQMAGENVPCVILHLTKEKEKELNIRLNKNTGEFDMDILANNFDVAELKDWGFKDIELGFNIDKIEGNIDDDHIPEVITTRVKLGDIWELGNHRLMCGDSTKQNDVKKLMKGEKADMIFTDPPYGVSYTGREVLDKIYKNYNGKKWGMIKGDNLRGQQLYHFLNKAFTQMYRNTKINPAGYIFHASNRQIIFENALNDAGFEVKQQLIWNKGMNLGRSDYHWSHEPCFYIRKENENNKWYGDRTHKTILREEKIEFEKLHKSELVKILNTLKEQTTVWEIKKDSHHLYIHPTQKPVDLIVRALLNNTKPKEIIIDLFLGSGSSIIGAEKTKRKCYGMELDPKYCDVIIERWELYTKLKATKCGA
jgi:DNA modification methylase